MSDAPGDKSSARDLPASSVDAHVNRLIDGPATMTVAQLAETAGVSRQFVRTFWRAMGFANVDADDVVFTDADVRAVKMWKRLLESGRIDERTAVSLLRAESHITDRLVLWQIEALVDDAARRLHLDDTSARLLILSRISDDYELLTEQLAYAWRRQLAALALRIDAEVGERRADALDDELPLVRALGFVDMVSYTSRSLEMNVAQLSELVQGFEFTCRDVITTLGGRIVKTIGDAVLYIADDLPTGAAIVTNLMEALRADPRLLPVRASLVHGRVVSHSGDIFGPIVNVASRLCDIAEPATVVMDERSAALLATSDVRDDYVLTHLPLRQVHGLGTITPVQLERRLSDDD
ncbi:MAG: adenylate/guanylate cyclase domain-containing protein [Bowdeniella nasicola]|nr:adenylate/guanylate cyclase domain-containing protein [Bowdeniella nasicola]